MKLSIVRGGGVAGIVTRTEVASEALAPEDERALREQVVRSGLPDLAEPPALEPTPDALSYEITLEDAGTKQRVRLSDEQLSEPLRSLIAWVDSVPGREERFEAPGPQER